MANVVENRREGAERKCLTVEEKRNRLAEARTFRRRASHVKADVKKLAETEMISPIFFAEPAPSPATLGALTALAPANPFVTPAYLKSREALGRQSWILGLKSQEMITAGCAAFLKPHPLAPSLHVPSAPLLSGSDARLFWKGLVHFCTKTGVWSLSVNTSASSGSIPVLTGEVSRRSRYEYRLDLKESDLRKRVSAHHRRNIKRAQRAGVALDRTSSEEACREHVGLLKASMERRRKRGEDVRNSDADKILPYLRECAGELFRAVAHGKVLSSILVLMAPQGGYYQSAGTSSEGMACGASHFLVYQIAKTLQAENKERFNLGGAQLENQGLRQFKAGFGAESAALEAAEIVLGGKMRKQLLDRVRSIRSGCQNVARYLRSVSLNQPF